MSNLYEKYDVFSVNRMIKNVAKWTVKWFAFYRLTFTSWVIENSLSDREPKSTSISSADDNGFRSNLYVNCNLFGICSNYRNYTRISKSKREKPISPAPKQAPLKEGTPSTREYNIPCGRWFLVRFPSYCGVGQQTVISDRVFFQFVISKQIVLSTTFSQWLTSKQPKQQ